MAEPEESFATSEDELREVFNESLLRELKEEPFEEFLSASELLEIKASNQFAGFIKEIKDEPLDNSFEQEPNWEIQMRDTDYKKEEMPEYDYVEPKLEVLEDRVVMAIENPDGLKLFDDFNTNVIRPRGRKKFNDEQLASSTGLPVSAHEIVQMSTIDLRQLLKMKSLSELQRETIRNIRRRGNKAICRKKEELRKQVEVTSDDYQNNTCNQELFEKSFATPQCILCEEYPSTVNSYIYHLTHHHKSSLTLNGSYLLCSCGAAVRSISPNLHRKKCAGIEFTLIKLDKCAMYYSPKCILCEIHLPTVYEFTSHLNRHHNSTLESHQVYLLCSCGAEVYSNIHESQHTIMCAGIQFSLMKVKKTDPLTPQCIFCEKFPSTAYSYAFHLTSHHQSSLIKNGLFIMCSCGHQIRSSSWSSDHRKECNATQFSLLRDVLKPPMKMSNPGLYAVRKAQYYDSDHCYCLIPS